MQVDFRHVDDVESFVSVPEGVYVCTIREVRETTTRDGAPRWWYRMEVAEGDHAGRTGAWDGISFSDRAMGRAKKVLQALGFDTNGVIELDSQDLVGCTARVELVLEEREDQLSGRRVARMRVPYMGYQPVEPEGASEVAEPDGSEDQMPF